MPTQQDVASREMVSPILKELISSSYIWIEAKRIIITKNLLQDC